MPDARGALPAPLGELLRAHPRACVILYGRQPSLSGVHWSRHELDGYIAEVRGRGALDSGLSVHVCEPTPEGAFAVLVERLRAREVSDVD